MLNLAVWNVRGLNKRDHQLAVKDLISEYRLDFMAILETRVRINNVMHIQSSLLPHWKWFVDYATVGNRIWIPWDENIVDVHILDLGNQFLHCRVTHRANSESLIITIVYGASEMTDRRSLWNNLETLAREKTTCNREEEDDLKSTGNFPAKDATTTLFETVALNQNAKECEFVAEQTGWKEPRRLGFSEIQTSATGVYPRSDAIDSFGRVPRPQLEQKDGNLVEEWTGTKLGFGAAIDAFDVEAAIHDDGSQRESENSPSAMSAEDLGTGNVNETNCSPGNSRDKNLGSMADGFHGDKEQPRFNFFEFLTLAHKVVNSSDVAAMAALSDLKQKWELQYGRPARIPAKTPRHVQPTVRHVVRCLLDDPTVPKQPLNNSNAAAEFTDSAAVNQDFSAALCAGNQPENEHGMAQKSQQQYTALLGGNTMEIQPIDTAAEAETAAEISDFSAAILA
ncbi:UNVERIFIED_CONTAM: hypothetical protein Sindi_1303100 [Sesamum indicum]